MLYLGLSLWLIVVSTLRATSSWRKWIPRPDASTSHYYLALLKCRCFYSSSCTAMQVTSRTCQMRALKLLILVLKQQCSCVAIIRWPVFVFTLIFLIQYSEHSTLFCSQLRHFMSRAMQWNSQSWFWVRIAAATNLGCKFPERNIPEHSTWMKPN